MVNDDLLKQGITAFKAGRKAEARQILLELIGRDERHELAWFWLSGAVETDKERYVCLEHVLSVNPHNRVARRGLENLLKTSPDLRDGLGAREVEEQASPPPPEPVEAVPEPDPEPAPAERIDAALKGAIAAIKTGAKQEGEERLLQVLKLDERNEAAWLWMTRCLSEPELKRECFERVLEINPKNEYAIRGLQRLARRSQPAESPSPTSKILGRIRWPFAIGTGGVGAILVVALQLLAG